MEKYRVRVNHFLKKKMFRKKMVPTVHYIVEEHIGLNVWRICHKLNHGIHSNKYEAIRHLAILNDLEAQRNKLPKEEFIYL